MKKILSSILMAAAVMSSCSKENITVAENAKVAMTFAADLTATKATLEGLKVTWQQDDEVAVYDGTEVNKFTVKSMDGSHAVLEGTVTAGSTSFYAVYPYSAAGQSLPVDGKVSFTLSSEQIVDANGIAPDAIVCAAIAVNGSFKFENEVSLVKLTIADTDVLSITMEGSDNELIAGVTAAEVGGAPEAGTINTVTIKPANGVFAPGDYYFAILPTTFAQGFRLGLNLADGKNYIQTSNSATFNRGAVKKLDTSGAVKIPFVIRTAEDMRNFAKNAGVYAASDVVKLAADIDLGAADWTPVVFKCTLDGQNHKVSGIKIAAGGRVGFISNMPDGAVLKNIVLGSADGLTYDGVSNVTYKGTAAGYQGGVVSDLQGTIENVKSFIAVNHSANDPGNRIGGLVGCIESKGKMIGCEFAGTVTLDNNTGSATHMAGGLVGRMHNNIVEGETVKNCSFTGTVTNNDAKIEAVGGFVGIMHGGSIVGGISAGTINMNFDAYYAYAGGVVGFYQSYASYTSLVSGVTNETPIAGIQRLLSQAGIVAYVQRGARGALTIDGCVNNADMEVQTAPTALMCMGGILGLTQDLGAEDVVTVKLAITNNVNNGKVEITPAATNVELRIGGIAGHLRGNTAFEVNGNINNGTVTATGKSVSAGGIVARIIAAGSVVDGNTNNGSIHLTSANQWSLAGGIVGYGTRNLSMSNNINKGDVRITSTATSDLYTAGLIGHFAGSSDTDARFALNISESQSTGAISSPGRAGVIFSALGGGTYVNCTLDKVGVGGSKNGTTVTSENYGSHLWSYTNGGYHTVTGAGTCYFAAN